MRFLSRLALAPAIMVPLILLAVFWHNVPLVLGRVDPVVTGMTFDDVEYMGSRTEATMRFQVLRECEPVGLAFYWLDVDDTMHRVIWGPVTHGPRVPRKEDALPKGDHAVRVFVESSLPLDAFHIRFRHACYGLIDTVTVLQEGH